MICKHCGKSFDQPLEFYDGVRACPKCFKRINLMPILEITKTSNELYELSEIYYYRALKSASPVNYKECIEHAVSLCRKAAELNHPSALMRMGFYYDKDYLDLQLTESARCKVAYEYYTAVCFNPASDIVLKDYGGAPVDLNKLKKEAALLLMEMLRNVPADLKRTKKYQLANYRDNFQTILGRNILNSEMELNLSAKDEYEAYLSIFTSCDGKGAKAPLAGLYLMRTTDLKQLFVKTPLLNLAKLCRAGLNLCFLPYQDRNNEDNNFIRLVNENEIKKQLDKITAEQVYIFFVNELGKHPYFKKKQITDMMDKLLDEKVNFDPVRIAITNNESPQYTFYDDDFIRYNHAKNLFNALKELANNIGKEEE